MVGEEPYDSTGGVGMMTVNKANGQIGHVQVGAQTTTYLQF